jgi:tetratricopeptide (TPR) repeat protein
LSRCGREDAAGDPEDLLKRAWMHFRLDEFDPADRAFASTLKKLDAKTDPRSAELRITALYGRGMVASLGRAGDGAREWFDKVIAADPNGEMGAWAALAMVRQQDVLRTSNTANLKAGYAKVIEQFPNTAAAEEAFFFSQSLLVESLTDEDAREAIKQLTERLQTSKGKIRTALYNLLGRAHQTLRQYPEALNAFIASLDAKENDPANPNQNNMLEYYRIGMMAQFDVGDFATARKYYQRYVREYPRDQRTFTVNILLKHLDETEAALRAGQPVPELSNKAVPK